MEDLVFVTLDFETDPFGNPLLAGQVIDDEFTAIGVSISTNAPDSNPVIIFDSANPTGGDDDLGTPNSDFGGPGVGDGGGAGQPGENSAPLGNVLIIAENTVDSDENDLIDVPDDNRSGGEITFTFDDLVTIQSLDVIDDDATEILRFETYDSEGNLISTINATNLGENSVQTVEINTEGVHSLRVISNGTFAIDNLKLGIPSAGLGDFVFEDSNGNGIQDNGENGVEGVLVKLQNSDGTSVLDDNGNPITTTTDANGAYSFDGLAPGEYKVMFVAPDGFVFTTPNAGSDDALDSDANPENGMTQTVILASGDFNGTLDAGIVQPAGLGDFVFEDTNGNGIQDEGENGIQGVLVKLQNPDGTSVLDDNGNPITTTTDANGAYSFDGLAPGEYKVMFVAPDGFVFTMPNAGGDDALDSDANPENGMTQTVILASGDFNGTLDAGIIRPASLGDTVFNDLNANGIQDDGEPGVAGVTVTLSSGGNDGVLGTADDTTESITTDANGQYQFSNLNPGEEYKVTFSNVPAGFIGFTEANQGTDDTVDSDANPANGMTQIVTLQSGENNTTLDAGLIEAASLGDFVFEDLNENGIQDGEEPGVAGVTVTLTGGGSDGIIGTADDVTQTQITDANGEYRFDNLNPGEEYKVTFDTTSTGSDFIFTQSNVGGDDAIDSDADPSNGMTQIVTLAPGEYNSTLDAGIILSNPDIDLEKFTNGIDADTPDAAAQVVVGETVTWTYKVTNTGNIAFHKSDIQVSDDQEGLVTNILDQGDGDDILSPGEMWVYQQQGVAQNLTQLGKSHTLYLTGNSYLDGHDGNIRTFSVGDISVKTSAFSRTKHGAWSKAFLGAFSSGLGVTDSSEGSGGNGLHRIDNVYRDNYVLFEFSEEVVVDRALLTSVSNDSDITYWVGTVNNAFSHHSHLNDAFLNNLEFSEDNNGGAWARWADINSNEIAGNVLVIAASTSDETPEDRFKLKAIDIQKVETGLYRNVGTVQALDVEDSDASHYVSEAAQPKIDIEKFTNGLDADTLNAAAHVAAGDVVTWTYKVTNTGNVSFNQSDIKVLDDQEGLITNITDQGNGDHILSPGEMWVYQQQGVAQNLTQLGESQTLYLTGNSYLDGHDGNIRTFSTGDISVKTSAFSRTKHGRWDKAFLGVFSSGLGVTDSSEGSGGNGLHRIDNVYRDNYVLFEFSEEVVVDQALLTSVSKDSDITYWVGTADDPFNNHNHLNDSFLNNLEFSEDNNGGSSARWADINAGEITGNILVIAASTSDDTPEDRFKLKAIDIQKVETGVYRNIGTVQALNVEDSDLSHYINPIDKGGFTRTLSHSTQGLGQ